MQDYPLAVAARPIRAARPDLLLVHFWHIPWPVWDVFRTCPEAQRRALLEGLLGSDLLGFHLDRFRQTFLECGARELDAEVDVENGFVDYHGHRTTVRSFPISIDVEAFDTLVRSRETVRWMARWRARPEIGDRRVAIGVDRLDYIKGIPGRLRAIDRFLRRHPYYLERFVFVQKAAPSRPRITAYRQLQERVERMIAEINTRHGRNGWRPILYIPESIPPAALAALYRLADVAVVSSLQDGMNLLAKEFIACPGDEHGGPLLRELAGAAGEAAASRLIARRVETRHLFEDLERIEAARRDRSLVLFLDYDGTLVPIAPTPDGAAATLDVQAVLRRLRSGGHEVVIVSGRAASRIQTLVGVDDLVYMGNHGLEVQSGDQPPVRAAPPAPTRTPSERWAGAVSPWPSRPKGRPRPPTPYAIRPRCWTFCAGWPRGRPRARLLRRSPSPEDRVARSARRVRRRRAGSPTTDTSTPGRQ